MTDNSQTQSTFGSLPSSEDIRSIGDIIRDTRALSAAQVAEILQHQRLHGLKFGEAAIKLGYASPDDVLHALAEQFNYAVADGAQTAAHPELVVLNQPFSQQAEAFRATRAQILMRTQGEEGAPTTKRALAVLSPNSGDGKTFLPPTWPWLWRSWAAAPWWWTPTCAGRACTRSLAWTTTRGCRACCRAAPART
ncbi:hypothetical protein [Ideonella paludis]|uniref:hypothetical protein n=1 Tax=Ideonella paludis TaxID=1233411 RepID=UPI00362FC755